MKPSDSYNARGRVKVVPARSDGNHRRPGSPHVRQRVLDQRPSYPEALVLCCHREDVDLAVPLGILDDPTDVARQLPIGTRDSGEPAVLRIMHGPHVASVVLLPVPVPVHEHRIADDRAEGILVERPEGIDRQIENGGKILGTKRTNVHRSAPFAESKNLAVVTQPVGHDGPTSWATLRYASDLPQSTPCRAWYLTLSISDQEATGTKQTFISPQKRLERGTSTHTNERTYHRVGKMTPGARCR